MTFRIFKILIFFLLCASANAQHVSKLSADQRGSGTAFNLNSVPPASEIHAADELVWTDSTISWQEVINQTRDSVQVDTIIAINTAVTSSTITELIRQNRKEVHLFLTMTSAETQDESITLPAVSTLTGKEGLKLTISVKDSDDTYDYYVLPTVPASGYPELIVSTDRYANRYYLDPDEVAVFVLSRTSSGLVWKLENSTTQRLTRNANAYDFKNKRFFRASTVTTELGADYFIQNVSVSAYNSNNPDSTFVYLTKDKAPWSVNNVKNSEGFGGTNWTHLGGTGTGITIPSNNEPAPDGTNTAERVVRVSNNGLRSSTFSITSGNSYTFSVYIKTPVASSNDDMTMLVELNDHSAGAQTITPTTSPKLWRRYSVTLTANATNANSFLDIAFSGTSDVGDSLIVWGFQIEPGTVASDYKRTETTVTTEGTVYAVYKPSGVVEIDKVYQRQVDYLHIQSALNYAATQKEKTVFCVKDRLIRAKIDIPIGASLMGTYKGGALGSTDYTKQGTVFSLDLRSGSVNAFEFPATATYEAGSTIEGIIMLPISTGRAAIKTNDGFYQTIRKVSVENYVNTTRHLSYGIEISASSIQAEIDRVQIGQASIAGVLCSGSTQHSFTNTKLMDCEVGMISTGDLYLENVWFEDMDSCAIIHEGGTTSRVTLMSVYTEAVPANASGSTANVYLIKAAGSFNVIGGLINGEGDDNTLVKLENVKTSTFIGSRFVNGDKAIETTSATGKLTLIGNYSSVTIPPESFEGIYDSTRVVNISPNEDASNPNYNNVIPKLETYDAEISISNIDSSQINQPTIHTELLLNSPTVGNRNENIVVHSERVENGTGDWANLSSVTFTQNDTTAYDGTSTAERVTFSSGLGEFRYSPTSVPLVVGQWYTISFWVANSSFDEITVELGDVSAEAQTITLTNSNTWIRYSATMKHTAGSSIIDFITNGSASQYMHFWGVQVERNRYMGEYIKTTGTVITSGLVNPTLIIQSGDILEFDGDIAAQGAIVDSTGSAGTSRQVPVSTSTGWYWDDLVVGDITGLNDSFADINDKSYVELYNDKVSSIVQTVVANTPEQLHTLINGLTNDFTETNDTITYTGTTTEIFHLTCSFAWSNDTAPSDNLLYIYLNDIEVVKFYAEQAFTVADDFHEGATSGLLELDPGDQITVYIESTASSDIEIKHMNISLTEL